jgi:DNA repair protein RadC
VHNYVRSLSDETFEWLLALYLDLGMNLLAVETVGQGSVSHCNVDIRYILSRGLQLGAAGFVLVHNHPNGTPKPSKADYEITQRLWRTGDDLDCNLLDHFIVAGDELISVGFLR